MSTETELGVTKLTGIAPQFRVDDLDASIAYYRERLGFELDFCYESFYASVSRDGFPIHLKCAPKTLADRAHRKRHEHLDAHIGVVGATGLHDASVARSTDHKTAGGEAVVREGFLRRRSRRVHTLLQRTNGLTGPLRGRSHQALDGHASRCCLHPEVQLQGRGHASLAPVDPAAFGEPEIGVGVAHIDRSIVAGEEQ